MRFDLNISPGASRRQIIAAIQWIENYVANANMDELGELIDVCHVNVPVDGTTTFPDNGKPVAFRVEDEGTFAHREEFWIEDEEVPPMLFGSEMPEQGIIELDFENRNIT